MKKIVLLATAFMFSIAVMAQAKADDVIKLNVEKHDFGKLKQGVPVTYYFEIKNISDKPIVVENGVHWQYFFRYHIWLVCGLY